MAEIFVHPAERVEDIEKRLVHPNIRGLKCYHQLAQREATFNASIGEYLPESAWEPSAAFQIVKKAGYQIVTEKAQSYEK